MDADQILTTDGFEEAQRAHLEQKRKIWPARAWYPSSVGHPCDRALVWRFTRWDSQTLHGHVLQSIFDQGNELQPIIQRRLEALGFTVQGEGDRPKQYRVKGALISGRPDGKLIAYRGEKYRPAPVAEFKSMSSWQFERTRTLGDLRKSSSHWTRNYFAQGQLYAYLEDVPAGVYVLMDKTLGMLRLIPFDLDYAYVEELLQRVERLQPLVEQGVDPDPIPFDPSVCGGCGFKAQCYPPRDFGPGLRVIEDGALLEDLEEIRRLEEAADQHAVLTKSVKERLKVLVGAEGEAVIGPWSATLKKVHKATYSVPEHDETHVKFARSE